MRLDNLKNKDWNIAYIVETVNGIPSVLLLGYSFVSFLVQKISCIALKTVWSVSEVCILYNAFLETVSFLLINFSSSIFFQSLLVIVCLG